jgi:nucleoside-diphosphate-sugar epimerase
LGIEPPAMQSLEEAALSAMTLAFYAENRKVSNQKAKRLLNWQPLYPTYKQGLREIYDQGMPKPD